MPVPTDYDRSQTQAESKHLKAADYPLDQKWRLEIEDVNLVELDAREGGGKRKRLEISFVGREKTFICNATNQSFIEERLGFNPNDWIGASVVLWRTTTKFEGKSVPAFRFLEAKKGTKSKPATKPAAKPMKPAEEYDVDPPDEGHAAQFDDDTPF